VSNLRALEPIAQEGGKRMLMKRDELLGRLTTCLGTLVNSGNFIGHESGVSVVILHRSVADMTWDELEASDDPVGLARERIAVLIVE
jgi:hypothetical protein